MRYAVQFTPHAERSLRKLPPEDARRLRGAAYGLAEEPRPNGCKKLKGQPGYRIAVGRFRIVYDIQDDLLLVSVLDAGPRKDIYRG